MPLALQMKLLRALQEREVVPLGGGRAIPVDFMLVCATNRNLWDLVQAGTFRSDLYFRIAQYTFELSPLRHRSDRAQLVDELWDSLGARTQRIALAQECRAQLVNYEWPGNFRQLVGCLRAMLALCEPGAVDPGSHYGYGHAGCASGRQGQCLARSPSAWCQPQHPIPADAELKRR
jgi:transcriptional regulator of acetoin/glycerol metabolism